MLSALRLIVLDTNDEFAYGDPTTYTSSLVVGVLLDAAGAAGVLVKAQMFGRLEDPFFAFPLHDNLYLSTNGVITNTAPTTGHSVLVGQSLGTGAIFIKIEQPIILP